MNQPASLVLRSLFGFKNLLTVPSQNLDWPCYISHMPDNDKVKTNAVCIYDRPGIKEGRFMKTGEVLELFSCQVKVRCSDYRAGWLKMAELAKEMDSQLRLGIDAGNYLYFLQAISRGSLIPLGVEDGPKRNHSFVVDVTFPCIEEGPYPEWGNENGALYTAAYRLHEAVHVDFPLYFQS